MRQYGILLCLLFLQVGASAVCKKTFLEKVNKLEDAFLRDAFRLRYVYLEALIAKGRVPADSLANLNHLISHRAKPFPIETLNETPNLKTLAEVAARSLLIESERTRILKHVNGSAELVATSASNSTGLKGGGHRMPLWEELMIARMHELGMDDATLIRVGNDRLKSAQLVDRLEIENMKDNGFDITNPMVVGANCTTEAITWSFGLRENGAGFLVLPKRYYLPNTWNSMFKATQHGRLPLGAKSLFPTSWDDDKIIAATKQILLSPDTEVLLHYQSNGKQVYYLKAKYSGIWIEIGMTDSRIGTVFPSWRQFSPSSIEEAYQQFLGTYFQLNDAVRFIQDVAPDLKKRPTNIELLEIYFSEKPDGWSDNDYHAWRRLVDPAYWQVNPTEAGYFRAMQYYIGELIVRDKTLQNIEQNINYATMP